MATVETVRIVSRNKGGYVVINKEDLTNKHTIFREKEILRKSPETKKEGMKNE